jgi:hypothetical protein
LSSELKSAKLPDLSTASDLFDAPGDDWLPIRRAPFYFLPEYTRRGQDWVRAIMHIAEFGRRNAKIEWEQVPDEGENFLVRSGDVEFEVDPVAGKLSLRGAHGEFLPV